MATEQHVFFGVECSPPSPSSVPLEVDEGLLFIFLVPYGLEGTLLSHGPAMRGLHLGFVVARRGGFEGCKSVFEWSNDLTVAAMPCCSLPKTDRLFESPPREGNLTPKSPSPFHDGQTFAVSRTLEWRPARTGRTSRGRGGIESGGEAMNVKCHRPHSQMV